jgi:hypothetical protein
MSRFDHFPEDFEREARVLEERGDFDYDRDVERMLDRADMERDRLKDERAEDWVAEQERKERLLGSLLTTPDPPEYNEPF